MICPFCKEEIADGAIKCKHCRSMLNLVDQDPAPNNMLLNERIDASNRKDSIKTKFKLFFNKEASPQFYGPSFKSKVPVLQYANWFALIFNCWYYIFTGTRKKGLALLGLAVGVSIIGGEINPNFGQIGTILTAAICFQSANYDRYRKEILNEDFWW